MVATQAVEPEVREMTIEQLMKMNGLTLANSAESHHADIVITENTMAEAHPVETRATKRSRVDDDAEEAENLAAPQTAKPIKVKPMKKKTEAKIVKETRDTNQLPMPL